ncbi:hypothetical protein GGI19_002684 [Coemansia pectinata]|uniref:Monopolin complex subunit Csm1/Pcs1 C-terminal domain-containing protein n=1 Tax=Coemansia pectinata TaxID=1052879 RepID=A0A9W8H293_9FUNG|nr:hypothetical protein GGI19_002684 [Coemansia pectinata]
MPPRKSNKAAATTVSDSNSVTPRKKGRPAKGDAAKATQQAIAKSKRTPVDESDSDNPTTTPTRRLSTVSKGSQLAPPDTLGMTRRTRPTIAATTDIPVTRSSPRSKAPPVNAKPAAAAVKAKTTRGRGRPKAVTISEVVDDSDNEAEEKFADTIQIATPDSDDYDLPGQMTILDTPSKNPTKASPLLFTRLRPPPKLDIAQDSEGASPKPKRGRKRKSDADILPSTPSKQSDTIQRPPAKRGRPRKSQAPEPDQNEESETAPSGRQSPVTPVRTRAAPVISPRHEVYVDIVSPSMFERSRARISTTKQEKAQSSSSAAASADESTKWRKKYEDLCVLRQSQPEREYEELKKSSQERFDAADALIAKLRGEVAVIKRKAEAELKKPLINGAGAESRAKSASEKELEKQVVVLQQQIEALTQDVLSKDEAIERLETHRKLTETSTDYNLREALKLMQEMSGLAIEDVVPEDAGLSYLCRQTGPNATVSYKLTVSDEYPGEFQYTPSDSSSMPAALPDYLRDSISFEKSSATMFYWRMCDHLHQPNEDRSATDQDDAVPAATEQARSEDPQSSHAT